MENYLQMLTNDLKALWENLDSTRKLVVAALLIATFAAIGYIIMKSTEPQWGILYSDLSDSDAAAITQSLMESGHQFKLSDDRKTVLVPDRIKEDLRLMIAENDVIKDSNPGFNLLNKMQFGATDFQNKLTKQKIFQDELTRTIEKINGIQKVRIQIAEPDRSVFAQRDELPTASVMLILRGNVKLKVDQVKAIKNLVAYGIPRLTPERVFITDQNGVNLSDKLNENQSGLNDFRLNYEEETASKVRKVLQRLVGYDNVSVQVSAEINFDRTKKTIEKYLPAHKDQEGAAVGILASSREEIEAYGKGQDKNGVSSETPETEEEIKREKETNYQKTRNSKDYKVSKEIEQVVFAPGKVERMTIAVALNRILTSEQKEEIKSLVASASGANFERGDTITVTGMQFAPTVDDSEPMLEQIRNMANIEFLFAKVGPLVVVLILGIGVLYILSFLLKRPIQGQEVYNSEEYYEEIPEEADQGSSIMEATAPMKSIEMANMDPEIEKMKNEINTTIDGDPSEAARLLLSYIKE